MVEDVGLVVAEVANRILTVVRILKCAHAKVWQSVQVKDLLKVANAVVGYVELLQLNKAV